MMVTMSTLSIITPRMLILDISWFPHWHRGYITRICLPGFNTYTRTDRLCSLVTLAFIISSTSGKSVSCLRKRWSYWTLDRTYQNWSNSIRAMSTYKLYYFPVRGRGEAIRLLLADNNVEYEEINVAPNYETWERDWKWMMPFGQAPLLIDGDLELAQSMAILRHLARKIGRSGASVEDRAKLDMINDYVEDIRNGYVKLMYTNYDDGKEEYIQELNAKLKPFETLLQKWGNDFITRSIAFTDYNLFDLLDIHLTLSPSCLDDFHTLRAYYDRILNRPRIKEYRLSESFKSRTINYNGKQ